MRPDYQAPCVNLRHEQLISARKTWILILATLAFADRARNLRIRGDKMLGSRCRAKWLLIVASSSFSSSPLACDAEANFLQQPVEIA
jgi:hypothetical protein